MYMVYIIYIWFMKQRKNIDLSYEVVIAVSIEAIKNKTNFKNYIENLIENHAKRLQRKDKK